MKNILKLAVLFLTLVFFISCGLLDVFDLEECNNKEEMRFTHKIKFGELYSDSWIMSFDRIDRMYSTNYDFSQLNKAFEDSVRYSKTFVFHENKTFSYLETVQYIGLPNKNNDTVLLLNGKFNMPAVRNRSWHVLILSADSIYKKEIIRDTLNDSLYFPSDFTSSKFLGLEEYEDHILTDKPIWNPSDSIYEADPNCFILSRYVCPQEYCNGYYLNYPNTFCIKQPEETTEQNSTGDNL